MHFRPEVLIWPNGVFVLTVRTRDGRVPNALTVNFTTKHLASKRFASQNLQKIEVCQRNINRIMLTHSLSAWCNRLLPYWLTVFATCWTLAFFYIWNTTKAYERYDGNVDKVR